jgi:hypothetical protein
MTAKMAVLVLAVTVALGGLGAGFIRAFDDGEAVAVDPVELRKDDNAPDLVAQEDDDEGDGDSTRGDDGTRGGDNTGDRDSTRGNDGTRGGDNTGDRDSTRGNDGTRGGDNTGDRDATHGNDGTRGGDNTGDGDATWGSDGTAGGDNSFVAPADPGYYGGGDSGGGYSTG